MQLEKLEQELETKTLRPIYAFYGEEQYLLENCVNKIKKIFGQIIDGINYVVLDENSVSNVISELETPSFGYEKKLIILKKTGILKKEAKTKKTNISFLQEDLQNYIETNINQIKDTVILLIIDENADKIKLLETVEKHGAICNFEKLKPISIIKRLKKITALYKVNIDEKTLNKLIEVSGTSMQVLINEIRKLIEYVGDGGTITTKDVETLATPAIDSVVFDLINYLGNKNINKSLETLHDLLYLKEPIQMILIMLYRNFKKIYLVKLAQNSGINVANVLELKPNQMFLINKYKTQAKYFSEKQLRIFLNHLIELDERSKVGNIDLEIGLEAVLCNFAGKEEKSCYIQTYT
ncbi:MAG: DNA polymerase III subunit delta [Oscillospiraceae bacterium]|nr:DNA polymerase III subunit delta [Oscillospiraceae bacterium]